MIGAVEKDLSGNYAGKVQGIMIGMLRKQSGSIINNMKLGNEIMVKFSNKPNMKGIKSTSENINRSSKLIEDKVDYGQDYIKLELVV